ncbi:MAG: nucleotidyltransferase family protein [Nitrososphaerales archaeon]
MSASIDVIPLAVRKSLGKITEEFAKHGIRAMAVGGIAVVFHGNARLSRDLDIAVAIDTREKAEGLLSLIKRSDLYSLVYPDSTIKRDETPLDSAKDLNDVNLIKIKDRQTKVMIDVLLVWEEKPSIYGLDRSSFERAINVEANSEDGKETFTIPSPEDFILMKLVARRPATADFEDLFTTMVKNARDLDWSYLSKRAKELKIANLLESYKNLAEEQAKNAESKR